MSKNIKAEDLIPPQIVAEFLDVTVKTVSRWEKKHNWTIVRLNERLKRLLKSEVEETLGVRFPEKA